jgi:hypothetical protein
VFYRFFRISILMCSPHFWPALSFPFCFWI